MLVKNHLPPPPRPHPNPHNLTAVRCRSPPSNNCKPNVTVILRKIVAIYNIFSHNVSAM